MNCTAVYTIFDAHLGRLSGIYCCADNTPGGYYTAQIPMVFTVANIACSARRANNASYRQWVSGFHINCNLIHAIFNLGTSRRRCNSCT